ncbi:MAG: cobalamin biosynthesis protein CbiG [Deltaproteobacteria bacterium]|nr:MAG: cobalamin biosynthesis protein CbiG [Deltaproteobacteria bacterium]
MKEIAVYALTRKGAQLAKSIARELGSDLFLHKRCGTSEHTVQFESLRKLVSTTFSRYSNHVFIAATGIVVRVIAPLISSKDRDPAVVVLDQNGRFCISLLSGHLGGANELARKIASITGGEPVITTATDIEGLPAIDLIAMERNFAIANPDAIKVINAAILDGENIQIYDTEDRLGLRKGNTGLSLDWLGNEKDWKSGMPGIWVSYTEKSPEPAQLVLHPRCLVVGIGCNKGTRAEEVLDAINNVFRSHGLATSSLLYLSSIEAKKNEAGLIEAARQLKVTVKFFAPEELEQVDVPNPSDMAKKYVGAKSVCEAAAMLAADQGKLIVPKKIFRNVTVAVALAP